MGYNVGIRLFDYTYVHTGHLQLPRSLFSCKYDSKSKHCMCLQSLPLAGSVIRLNVIGHFNGTCNIIASQFSEGNSLRTKALRQKKGMNRNERIGINEIR